MTFQETMKAFNRDIGKCYVTIARIDRRLIRNVEDWAYCARMMKARRIVLDLATELERRQVEIADEQFGG